MIGLNTFSHANIYPLSILPLRAAVVYFGLGVLIAHSSHFQLKADTKDLVLCEGLIYRKSVMDPGGRRSKLIIPPTPSFRRLSVWFETEVTVVEL